MIDNIADYIENNTILALAIALSPMIIAIALAIAGVLPAVPPTERESLQEINMKIERIETLLEQQKESHSQEL